MLSSEKQQEQQQQQQQQHAGGGSVVLVSAALASHGVPNYAAFSAAKAALEGAFM